MPRLSVGVRGATLLAFCAIGLLDAAPASAHPHVWVEATARILFDKAGLIDGVRNDWVFDEMYSAFAVQGLENGGRLASVGDLASLAKTNIESLAEYDYFTYAKADGHKLKFGKPIDYTLEERPDKRVVLHFTLPLLEPTRTGRAMSLQIYDPTYFVDFELAAQNPVSFADAPSGCSKTVLGANPLVLQDGKELAKAFDTGLAPSDDFAVKMAGRVIVACP